jgi:toluene monooxygenase system ferredoxin subunit
MFRRAADSDGLWDGEMVGVTVAGLRVLLVRVEGHVFAYEDRCVHQAVALSGGRLDGAVITCPAHEWQYDARTGAGINPQGPRLRVLPVRVERGSILVDVDHG